MSLRQEMGDVRYKLYLQEKQDTYSPYLHNGSKVLVDGINEALAGVSASLTLGETSTTAYRGDRGKVAYDHSQATHDYIQNQSISALNASIWITGNITSNGEISAYGIGTDGGGGGGGLIENVYNFLNLGGVFSNSILTDTFNAFTINEINIKAAAAYGWGNHSGLYDLLGAATAITPTTLGLVIGTNVLAYRTFGTAANNNTGDFIANQSIIAQNANMWISGNITSNSEITAYGIGSSENPAAYDRLDLWTDYIVGTTEDYVLSAKLGWDLFTRPLTLGALTNIEDTVDVVDTQAQVIVKEGTTWKKKLYDHVRRAIADLNGLPIETAIQYLSRVTAEYRYIGLSVVLKLDDEFIRYEFADGITDENFQPLALANDFLGGIHRIASAESVKIVYDLATNINPGTF